MASNVIITVLTSLHEAVKHMYGYNKSILLSLLLQFSAGAITCACYEASHQVLRHIPQQTADLLLRSIATIYK